jgi:hypothetical protein
MDPALYASQPVLPQMYRHSHPAQTYHYLEPATWQQNSYGDCGPAGIMGFSDR